MIESVGLLDVKHQVSTIQIFHHKIQMTLKNQHHILLQTRLNAAAAQVKHYPENATHET